MILTLGLEILGINPSGLVRRRWSDFAVPFASLRDARPTNAPRVNEQVVIRSQARRQRAAYTEKEQKMIWGKVCIGWRIEKLRREAEHARLVYDSLPDKNSDTAKGFFALETACNSAAEAMEEILSAFYDALPESDDDANEQQEAISIAQPTNCSLKHDTAFLFCPGCHNRLKRTKMCPDGEWLWCETCQACIKPGTELRVENPDLPV